MDGLDNKPCVT